MRSKRASILLYSTAILTFLIATFPFYWAIISSFKSGSELFGTTPFPSQWSLSNYIHILREEHFGDTILNSTLVATGTVILSLVLAISASYALGRIRFRGRTRLLLAILSISMFPQVAVLSGMFELIRGLGIYNSLSGLVLSYMIFTLPFTVWVLTTFMKQLPKEIEEAAILDGASTPRICFQIFLPVLWPALITTGLLAFIAAWNEFLFALSFTIEQKARTVPVAIALMSGASEYELPWGYIMAASVLVTLPLIFLVLCFQKRIVSGLTAGAVKG